jgi:hypothetical protein
MKKIQLRLAEAEDFSVKAMVIWKELALSITLKVHATEDHCVNQRRIYRGLGELDEEFIERMHQSGVQDQ